MIDRKMKATISKIAIVSMMITSNISLNWIRLLKADALSSSGSDRAIAKPNGTKNKPSTVSTVYLGGKDKEIRIFVPEKFSSKFSKKFTRKDGSPVDRRGPSEFALSQLIAHCPSLVDERNVLELSSGLGLVAAVACKYSRPNHVAITDHDKSLLSLAYASCVELQRSKASVSRCHMDWSEPSTWPQQEYDMLLAADVFNDKDNILSLVNVIQYYLCNDTECKIRKQAVIVDPINQINRNLFCYAARRAGLRVDQKEFPGSPDLMLLSISPTIN
mmetsp:Transcript_3921/g.10270  ORF Transcript_3921/g.10270 Transcript_3921/m.10270 type:complete len:274 (-) Transcript_3921:67-888(-)